MCVQFCRTDSKIPCKHHDDEPEVNELCVTYTKGKIVHILDFVGLIIVFATATKLFLYSKKAATDNT